MPMAPKEALVAATVGVAIYDWLAIAITGYKFLNHYTYLPFGRRRKMGITLLSTGVFISFALRGPLGSRNPFWMVMPAIIGMGLHAWLAFPELLKRYWLEQVELDGS